MFLYFVVFGTVKENQRASNTERNQFCRASLVMILQLRVHVPEVDIIKRLNNIK